MGEEKTIVFFFFFFHTCVWGECAECADYYKLPPHTSMKKEEEEDDRLLFSHWSIMLDKT